MGRKSLTTPSSHTTDFSLSQKAPEKFAEVNGFLCGFICSGIEAEGKMWLESVLANLKLADSDVPIKRSVLIELYKHIADQMQTETFGLNHTFSKEQLSLNTRAYALKKWCNGFLNGLQQAGLPLIKETPSLDLANALESLDDISKLDLERIDIREEDEQMFTQVTTFIDLAVIQIYRILNHVKAKH